MPIGELQRPYVMGENAIRLSQRAQTGAGRVQPGPVIRDAFSDMNARLGGLGVLGEVLGVGSQGGLCAGLGG
jgi:hypothetical protein